jgi:hypothetical protein
VRSLPIPTKVLRSVWPDPAWQKPLRDAVVITAETHRGFLRAVDPKKGIGLVTLDGETVFSQASEVTLPHPVHLPELDDFRDFATELQVEQGIPQLYREVWRKPPDVQDKQVSEFSNGKFGQLMFATSRCRTLGYQFSGGFAVTRTWENGASLEARYWIGSDAPEAETWTGDLTWVDSQSAPVELQRVGPVAYSEGMRMAAAIYAGRQTEA